MEQTLLMMAVAVLMAVLGLAATSSRASAQSEPAVRPTWAAWAFELTPVGGNYDARWTITIGGEDKAAESVVLHRQVFQLTCTPVDEVKIVDDVITFDGGYLTCKFPDLIETANEIIMGLWGPDYKLKIGAECKCQPLIAPYAPYAKVNAQVEGETSNPVFDHPSIQFDLGVGSGRVANIFTFANERSTGKGIMSGGMETFRSNYSCDPDLGVCIFEHYQGSSLVAQDKGRYKSANMVTSAVTVQVGRMGKGKDRFYGEIEQLVVDPGCRGT